MQKWGLPSNTKRFFNVIIALGFTLLVLWIFVLSQTESSKSQQFTSQQQQKIDSLRKALGRSDTTQVISESDSLLDNAAIVFILLGGALVILWFWSRKQPSVSESELFKKVGRQELAPGQSIQIIEMNDSYWILGITSNAINLLDKISKSEWHGPPLSYENSSNNEMMFTSLVKKYIKRDAT